MKPFSTSLCFIDKNHYATEDDLNILDRVDEHLGEALQFYHENQVVCIALQGSQNYGLQIPGSDVDTKLILTPSLNDLIFNRQPVSTTHIRTNNEHTDWKDIRLMFQTFRKQNLNFIEILFSPWIITNRSYLSEWSILVQNKELIAQYNPMAAIKTMRGIAMEKYHAMEHPYPSKLDILAKYGYDCKQLHHLLRVEEFIERYGNCEPYGECLHSNRSQYLIDVKQNFYNLEEARIVADKAIKHVNELYDEFKGIVRDKPLQAADDLLNEVQEQIMRKAIEMELNT